MIPKLDWRRFFKAEERDGFVKELSAALRGPGILRLSGHGIDDALIAQVFRDSARLFDLTEAEKRTFSMQPGPHNRGWARLGVESLADGSGILERREAYNIGLELSPTDPRVAMLQPFRTPTPWPALPGFRETMLLYYDALMELGLAVHQAISIDLGLSEGYFEPIFTDPLATLRLVTYPPGTGLDGETGAGAHTDFGAISLLVTDDEPGLQAQLRTGEWVDVTPEPDSVILLVGDCLEKWSNGAYRATPHRVTSPKNRRYAINFYFDPAPDVAVACLPELGPPEPRSKSYATYLSEKLDAAHRKMSQWA